MINKRALKTIGEAGLVIGKNIALAGITAVALSVTTTKSKDVMKTTAEAFKKAANASKYIRS